MIASKRSRKFGRFIKSPVNNCKYIFSSFISDQARLLLYSFRFNFLILDLLLLYNFSINIRIFSFSLITSSFSADFSNSRYASSNKTIDFFKHSSLHSISVLSYAFSWNVVMYAWILSIIFRCTCRTLTIFSYCLSSLIVLFIWLYPAQKTNVCNIDWLWLNKI